MPGRHWVPRVGRSDTVLADFAHSATSDVVRDYANELLPRMADALGVPVDALEDDVADDLGLGADGERLLVAGRAYVVRLESDLSLRLIGARGQRLRSIPAAAAEAAATWRALRSHGPRVVRAHVSRLERMMGDERRVSHDVFARSFLHHPIVGRIASKLVWCLFDSDGRLITSMSLGSGEPVDIDGGPVTLDGATIGLLHPSASYTSAENVARWRAQLELRLIDQPFDQLGRRTDPLSVEQLAARVDGRTATTDGLFALRSVGWRMERSSTEVRALCRRFGPNIVRLAIDPPLFSRSAGSHRMRLQAPGAVALSAVQRSELEAHLARLDCSQEDVARRGAL